MPKSIDDVALLIVVWLVVQAVLIPAEQAIAKSVSKFWRDLPETIVDRCTRAVLAGVVDDLVVNSMSEDASPVSGQRWGSRLNVACQGLVWAICSSWYSSRDLYIRGCRWMLPAVGALGLSSQTLFLIADDARDVTDMLAKPGQPFEFVVLVAMSCLAVRRLASTAANLGLVSLAILFVVAGRDTMSAEGVGLTSQAIGIGFYTLGGLGLVGVIGRAMRQPLADRLLLPMLWALAALLPIVGYAIASAPQESAPATLVLIAGIILYSITLAFSLLLVLVARVLTRGFPVVPGATLP